MLAAGFCVESVLFFVRCVYGVLKKRKKKPRKTEIENFIGDVLIIRIITAFPKVTVSTAGSFV